MPTKEEFMTKYRGRLLVLLAEAWACRREQPSALGLLMDRHALDCRRMLAEMYDDLAPAEKPAAVTNGHAIRRTTAT
jgi:hypothetical protein